MELPDLLPAKGAERMRPVSTWINCAAYLAEQWLHTLEDLAHALERRGL